MPYSYDQTEDDITARLFALFDPANATVITEPDNDADYKRGVEIPIITVAYSGSAWPKQQSTNQQSQLEEVSFIVNIQSRSRRGDFGIYSLEKAVKASLLGYQPPDLGRIYLKNFTPLGRDVDNNLWFWNLEIACTKLEVQSFDDEDPSQGLFSSGSLNDT